MNLFEKARAHLETVHMHRSLVRHYCFMAGLYSQGMTHDLSKYSLAELFVSVRYFQGYRSPYIREKELYGYSLGWLHHKGRNKHHWEYWYDMINGKWIPLEMPYPYLAEMVCDRIAACRTYQKEKYTDASALEYYLTRNDRLYMHPATAAELEKILTMLKDEGEEKTFAYIRSRLDEYKEVMKKKRPEEKQKENQEAV